MADELKQLTELIKNSADKRYALKEEVSEGGSEIVVNSHPVVSYISEADLNAKIANKVAELALLQSDPKVLIRTVVKWNMTTPSSRGPINFRESNALSGDNYMHGIAYVEPKNWLIVGYWGKKLRIYNAETYALIKEQDLPYNIRYIVSTYDGKRLLVFIYDGSNEYAEVHELNEATNTYEKKSSLSDKSSQGAMNYLGDKIVTAQSSSEKLLSYSMNNSGNWEIKSYSSDSREWRGIMIHQESLYAFTKDGKLWKGTYIDGVIGTMEEQVCDVPADKSDDYNTQAYMTIDGSIIYKIDAHNNSISTKTGKVYVFAKQDDNSWKLIDNITSSNPADNQLFGKDMCMNADNSKIWVSQYATGTVDRFDIAIGVELNATNTNQELLSNNKFETVSADTTIPESWVLEAKQDTTVLSAQHTYEDNKVKLSCLDAIDGGLDSHYFESTLSQDVDLSAGTYELYMGFVEGTLNSGYTNIEVGISIKIGSKDPVAVYHLFDADTTITIPNEIVSRDIDLVSEDLAPNGEATKVTIYTYINVVGTDQSSGGNTQASYNFVTIDALSLKLKD